MRDPCETSEKKKKKAQNKRQLVNIQGEFSLSTDRYAPKWLPVLLVFSHQEEPSWYENEFLLPHIWLVLLYLKTSPEIWKIEDLDGNVLVFK